MMSSLFGPLSLEASSDLITVQPLGKVSFSECSVHKSYACGSANVASAPKMAVESA